MPRPRRGLTYLASARRATALVALAAAAAASSSAALAAGSSSGLIVIPTPASGPALSYFHVSVARGGSAGAGAIVLRNTSQRTLRVALSAVDGLTLNTLGSTYAAPGSPRHGATRWVRVARRQVRLAAGATVPVAVTVAVPRRARPGDYLAGVSIETLHQHAETARHGEAIASVVRYVIGVESSIAGRRKAKLAFTGATLERQPSALVFLLDAGNRGNVILQNVAGKALITRGSRTVASVPLGPGTFVTKSSIAYPIPAPGERPAQGTVYRVRAYLKYAGGIARLDTQVRFGAADAQRQQTYGGKPAGRGSSLPAWLVALLGVAVLYGLAMTVLVLRRRHRPAPQAR
jgi:hypothetical protein